MRRLLFGSLAILTVALAAFGGYASGVRRGFALGGAASAVGDGAIATAELGLLDRANEDKARFLLEGEVDDGLVGWSELTASRASRWSLGLLGSGRPDYETPWREERFVRDMAGYRKKHPSPQRLPPSADDVAASCRGEPGCWDLAPLREREATIARVADRYAR